MKYLTSPEEIKAAISRLIYYKILWLDTEIADWYNKNKRLSLIQILTNPKDTKGETAYLLDVLDKPELIQDFINRIMKNDQIEKVFHNAAFDLQYLGGKEEVKNVTCTLEKARKIGKKSLDTPNLKLKTLAKYLCKFTPVQDEGGSDWGKRPLSKTQLDYAKMDVVYLAHVHQYLLNYNRLSMDLEELLDLQPVTNDLVEEYYPVLIESENQPSLTLDQISIAEDCPRLFYLNYHQGGSTEFKLDPQVTIIEEIFNQLSTQIIQHLTQNPQIQTLFDSSPEQLHLETLSLQIQTSVYEVIFFPYLQQQIESKPHQSGELLKIWQSLTDLIKHWTEIIISNCYHYPVSELLQKTFISSQALTYNLTLADGKQPLSGTIPPLIYHRDTHRLIFLSPQPQLTKIAIPSYILKHQQRINFNSVSGWTFPDLQQFNYSWSEIESTVNQLLNKIPQLHQWLTWKNPNPNPPPDSPNLCSICPQYNPCQNIFKTSPFISPPPTQKSSPPSIPDKIGQELVSILNAFRVKVDYIGAIAAPAFIRVKLKPHLGVKVVSIINRSEDLQVQLGIDSPPIIQSQAGFVSVDLPRQDRQVAKFEDYISSSHSSPSHDLKMAIGINLEGKLIEADLADANTCHFLIGGTTGSGKSEFLRSLLMSLLVRHTPERLKIVLVDPKRVTFLEFEEISWLYEPIIKDQEDAIALMDGLVHEMETRYKILEKLGYPDIKNYNSSLNLLTQKSIPRIVCIFDEYADFMAEKETREPLEQSIKRLGAKARAAGIHLIIATQRPDAKVVTPLIRANLPGRIALKTASAADSKIILGGNQTEAYQLLGKGDLLYLRGGTLERLQALFTSDIKL